MPKFEVLIRSTTEHIVIVQAPNEFDAAEQAIAELSRWNDIPGCETLSTHEDDPEYEVTSTGWLGDDDDEEDEQDV